MNNTLQGSISVNSIFGKQWSRLDEFSRGSYSFPFAGSQDSTFREALGRPLGNLYWAGEATDGEWYAMTEGAYNTGLAAGKQVSRRFRS